MPLPFDLASFHILNISTGKILVFEVLVEKDGAAHLALSSFDSGLDMFSHTDSSRHP